MRARPEPTQLEHLSLLGKLLVLPANVILDWKVINSYKYSSLFGLIVGDKRKSFITLTPGLNHLKHFSLFLSTFTQVKWCLHHGDNRSKLGLFKNAKNIYFFLKMH